MKQVQAMNFKILILLLFISLKGFSQQTLNLFKGNNIVRDTLTVSDSTKGDSSFNAKKGAKFYGSVKVMGAINMNSTKITNLADPSSNQEAATKIYVDVTAAARANKDSVRAATTAAGTLATSFENGDAIDGITLTTGNRILIKNQAAPAENGIYTVGASGAPTRATDFDASSEVAAGATTFVTSGTTNAGTQWTQNNPGTITIGSTAITFVQIGNTTIADNSVTNAKVATGIDAIKLADGSVNNTEFQYINTLSSNAQTQIDAKLATATAASTYQPLDGDLTTIAGLTATTDNFMVGNSSAWDSRTPAQARTHLGGTTVGQNLFTLTNPSAITFPRFNADNTVTSRTASELRGDIGAGTGNGNALTSSSLAQFAATTSLELKNIISNETGSGALVFGTSPDFTTGITIGGVAVPTVASTFNLGTTSIALNRASASQSLTGINIDGTAGKFTGMTKAELNTANSDGDFVYISDLGTNVGTFLATPSSANLRSALTDENGTGAALFSGATTPDFTTGFTIGAAAASGKFIVGNGTNYVPSTSTIPTSAGATANKALVSDGTNYVLSTGSVFGTVASADIAATASATATTTLFTPTADGMYRIAIYLKITTTGTSPVAGPVTITYTDADGSVAQSHVMLLQNTSGAVVTTTVNNSTTTGTVNGSMVVNAKSGVAIQYAIAVSGTFGSGRYTAHLVCERIK